MKIYVHPIEASEDIEGSAAIEFIDKIFKHLDKLFERISNWSSGDRTLFETDTDPQCRLLVSCVGTGDGYKILDFFMKTKDGNSRDVVSDTGVKFSDYADESENRRRESPEEYEDRFLDMCYKEGNKLISKLSGGKIDSVGQMTEISRVR